MCHFSFSEASFFLWYVTLTPPTSDNERRAKEAQAKVFAVLEIYKDTSKKPSIRAMAEEAGVERGTFSKHKKTWDQK
jgi:hypothetical protein